MGLRPYRGTKTKALEENIVLGEGEVFFEFPESGVGTGRGKIKMGDGNTPYGELPYFVYDLDLNDDSAIVDFTDSNTATGRTNDPTYLSNINPNANLKRVFTNLKQLLVNYNSELNAVREAISTDENKIANLTTRISTFESDIEDLNDKTDNIENSINNLLYSPESRNSFYRGKYLGKINSLETVRELLIDENHNFRDVFLGDTIIMDFPINGVSQSKWVVAGFNIFMGMSTNIDKNHDPGYTYLNQNHIVLLRKAPVFNGDEWKTSWIGYDENYIGTHYYSGIQLLAEEIGKTINNKLGCLEHILCPISYSIDSNAEDPIRKTYGITYSTKTRALSNPSNPSLGYFQNYAMIPSEVEFTGRSIMSSSIYDNMSIYSGKFPIFNFVNHVEVTNYIDKSGSSHLIKAGYTATRSFSEVDVHNYRYHVCVGQIHNDSDQDTLTGSYRNISSYSIAEDRGVTVKPFIVIS